MALWTERRHSLVGAQLLLQVHHLPSCADGTPPNCRCGNSAAILEFDETSPEPYTFKIFTEAPEVHAFTAAFVFTLMDPRAGVARHPGKVCSARVLSVIRLAFFIHTQY